MNLQLYIYFACALGGLVFHWSTMGKAEAARPSAWQWFKAHYGYALLSLGLTAACVLFFLPEQLGVNANAAALAFGLAGGEAIKNLFPVAR
jgi:hypothetical protein